MEETHKGKAEGAPMPCQESCELTDSQRRAAVAAKPEPSVAYRWAVLLALSIAMYGVFYAFDCIGPLAPLLSRQLHFSDADIGLLQAIYSFPNIFMVLIGGIVIDRIGTKKSIALFGATCFVGIVATALSPRLAVMAAGRLIFGIGTESMAMAVTTAIARWFRGRDLGFAFGIQLTIQRFGSLSAQVSPMWASRAYTHWRWPLLIGVLFGLFCVVGVIAYWMLESHAECSYTLGVSRPTSQVPIRRAFDFSLSFWLIAVMCVTFYSGIFPFQTFAQKFLIEARHLTPGSASLFVGIVSLAAMVGTPLFGLLVDRVAKRALFMTFGCLLLAPVYIMMVYPGLPLAIPIAMMAVAFSLVPAVMWPAVAYIVEEARLGFAYSLIDAIQQAGMVGVNLVIGWSNDHWAASATHPSGYRPGMWIFSALVLLAVPFGFWLRRTEVGPDGHGLETIRTRS